MSTLQNIAEAFELGGNILDVQPYGHGLINDTCLVTTDAQSDRKVILQRINTRVFPEPAWIMANLRALLDHVHERQAGIRHPGHDLRLPEIYTTYAHEDFLVGPDGGFWRATGFIDNACTIDKIASPGQAEEVGFALGRFHHLVHDLEPERLHDTLPGFHILPRYLERFTEVANRKKRASSSHKLDYCVSFIDARQQGADVLEAAKHQGLLRLRPIHGDPKLDNILFDQQSGHALSLIDLDTVKPGLIHYDIGDCLRSCCNPAGECADDAASVRFDLDLCHAILERYLDETRGFLTPHDYAYLYDAIRLIPFELGIRFLTDHLEGNNCFKIERPDQNLHRAMTQFQLTASVERNEARITTLIDELAAG